MSLTTTRTDLSTVKARQQRTWASGDFAVVAGRIVLVSEQLADAADLRAGW
ncbi:MAG TPA: SAM-dependent methyltransferase, partial [Actinomycetes bacterium]